MNEKQIKAIVTAAVEAARDDITRMAIQTFMEYNEKQRVKQIKARHDKRLWNTRLLLRNYQLLKEHTEKAVCSSEPSEIKKSAIDILDEIDDFDKTTYINSIKQSVAKTKIVLAHIDEMMKIYKICCETSDRDEDIRRYRIVGYTYFNDPRLKIAEICSLEGIDVSTFYRDSRESCEKLSALIFGIDGLSGMRK
jgi:hypothetical protein